MPRDLRMLHARPEPVQQPVAQYIDAAEQGRVALQSTPEIHGPDEIDQFALGAVVARVVLDRPRRER